MAQLQRDISLLKHTFASFSTCIDVCASFLSKSSLILLHRSPDSMIRPIIYQATILPAGKYSTRSLYRAWYLFFFSLKLLCYRIFDFHQKPKRYLLHSDIEWMLNFLWCNRVPLSLSTTRQEVSLDIKCALYKPIFFDIGCLQNDNCFLQFYVPALHDLYCIRTLWFWIYLV